MAPSGQTTTRTVLLTCAAMLAFAANSVLCRLALEPRLIDAASFTSVRLVSGAITLAAILAVREGIRARPDGNWRSVIALYAYMAFFSFAYLSLSAGTGALVLFGAVQLTMFIVALRSGEHFSPLSWAGLALAVLGLVYLVSPGVTAPDPMGALMMAIAGVSWGFYSLLGRGARDPLSATAGNFIYAVPLTVVLSLAFLGNLHLTGHGFALAVASGAVASACGYVIWYAALRGLTATRAATVQLSVPVIAAFGGVAFITETLTMRLVIASIATLGGVAIVLTQRSAKAPKR